MISKYIKNRSGCLIDKCVRLSLIHISLLMPSPDKSVIGVTPASVGSVEANEVLKLICGYGEPLAGKLWTSDLRTMQSYIQMCIRDSFWSVFSNDM